MKNMIDRYLYAVTRRLPENIRDDVRKELRSNIEDMLSENPSEQEIENVLTEMGSPSKLAVKYDPKPRYLVPPELFNEYITVLKAVSITLTVILALFAVFKIIFGDTGSLSVVPVIISVIGSFIGAVFTGIIQAFFWVTVAFYCFSYFGKNRDMKDWSPKNLPDIVSDSKSSFKRADIIGNAFFSILLTTIFLVGTIRHPQFIAWYQAGSPAAPLFKEQIVLNYLPFFIILMVLMLFISALKLFQGRWTVSSAVSQSIYSMLSAVVGVTFLTRPGVFTDAFVARFAEKVHTTVSAMTGYIHTGVTVICVLVVIGTVADIATTISKTTKSY